MSPSDYTAAAISTSLKLKGAPPASKISKNKKKKKKKKKEEEPPKAALSAESQKDGVDAVEEDGDECGDGEGDGDATAAAAQGAGKTEAEVRYEERRRRRLDERLKREGTKTHKERVEELNRYLSNLSEHHDMPRIGPG